MANTLSRCQPETQEPSALHLLFLVSSPIPDIIIELRHYFLSTPEGQKYISKMSSNAEAQNQFNFISKLIMFQNRIFIPDENGWRPKLPQEYPFSLNNGYSWPKPTLACIASSFFWPEC